MVILSVFGNNKGSPARKHLEGIVSKRAGSFYRCARSRNWLKTKNPNFVRT
jgi:ATP-dependent DNA ligase